MISIVDRFFSKVDKAPGFGPNGDCWRWTASVGGHGYGQLSSRHGKYGKPECAHRVSYELANGPIPDDMIVMHDCDTPLCVNPAHLRLGTHRDNMMDMVSKGRHAKVCRTYQPHCDSQSGVLGVSRHGKGWRADFKLPAGPKLWKHFRSFEDAVAQRREWEGKFK